NKWQNLVKRFIPVDSAYTISEAELLSFVEEARVEGSIEHDEHLLVKAAIEFDDVNVSSILTPRIDVVGAEIDDPDEKIEDIFEHSPFSRLVIYEETVDNVIGVLHEKDFHRYLKAKSQQKVHATSIVSLLSEVLFVPPVMKLSDLLRLMQRNKNHMAIIIDEHGGMTGIATMEDVLEELVGEIWDERDVIEEEFHVIEPDRKFLVKGTYSIVKLFERFDIDPDEEWLSHTVSGFVIESLERMPQQGDSYTCNHYRFEVVDVKNRRVDEIMITYEPDATDDDQVTE
ncbi:MAG: HlyC/CorC family transporter, partial [Bradyrhizobium icense]